MVTAECVFCDKLFIVWVAALCSFGYLCLRLIEMRAMMNIESVREYALSLHPQVTEELFAENWICFRICDKWFMLIQLDAPEPRVAVKLDPEETEQLREQYDGIRPAYHMNKRHWSDLYLARLDDALVQHCIRESYDLVVRKLPRKQRELLL